MPTDTERMPEGPFAGSTCLAGPGGPWMQGRIRRVNEDGTFTIEPDEKPLLVMPYWYGVTQAEVSFHDVELFPEVFRRLTAQGKGLNVHLFGEALRKLGFGSGDNDIVSFWSDTCVSLFGLAADRAKAVTLDQQQSYQLFRQARVSAKQLQRALNRTPEMKACFKPYWNLTRMGGRDTDEVAREVTQSDAFRSLGISDEIDEAAVAQLRGLESTHQFRFPAALCSLLSRRNCEGAIHNVHPNNPDLVTPRHTDWDFQSNLRSQGIEGGFGVLLLLPPQGDFAWYAVFDDGDVEPRIYLQEYDETNSLWRFVASTLSFFLWDLAQTGLAWHRETEFADSPRTEVTD
ncbi:MAG: hypothetical protein NT069_32940, partial [Planctomycetota bacterium]|nr:hypothetical protein [Planctomycetota bacterium]